MSSGEQTDDEGENFNKIADIEMEEQRNEIKKKIRDFVSCLV